MFKYVNSYLLLVIELPELVNVQNKVSIKYIFVCKAHTQLKIFKKIIFSIFK